MKKIQQEVFFYFSFFKMLLKLLSKLFVAMVTTIAVGFGIVFFLFFLGLFQKKDNTIYEAKGYRYVSIQGNFTKLASGVLVVPIHGIILGQKQGAMGFPFLLQQEYITYGSEIKKIILDAMNNEYVDALLLEIDSPGGTIFGTQMIVDAIFTYKKTGKPVYAHIIGDADSGGYWIASTADEVYAEYGSNIGGIGVIVGPFKQYEGVVAEGTMMGSIQAYGNNPLRPGGITTTYITAGKYKDFGNPYRKMSDEERINIQRNVDEIYSGFVAHVAMQRNISGEVIKNRYGAHVFVATRAKKKKLIDDVANRDQVIEIIAKKLGREQKDLHIMTVDIPQKLFGFLPFIDRIYSSYSNVNRITMVKKLFQTSFCDTSQPLVYYGDLGRVCSDL